MEREKTAVTFKQMRKKDIWRPIPGCPGRFLLKGGPSPITPESLTGGSVSAKLIQSSPEGDPVIIVAMEDGGLISYLKEDGRYIHTLCNREGFKRKLKEL